jgi:hypothetical protein
MPHSHTHRPTALSHASFEGMEALEQRLAMSTVHWDGGGDGVTLTDRYNWQCNHLPGKNDTAIIDVAGDPALVMNAGLFKVKKLVLAEQLTITGGTVTVSSGTTVSGTLNMAGGLFDGCGALNVTGKLKWTGGKISGGGNINIAASGLFAIAGSGTLELRRDVTNRGTTIWSDGNIEGYDSCGTVIINAPGALFKATGLLTRFRSNGHPGAFINQGTFVRDNQGVTKFVVPVSNSGTLNVAAGALELFAGGVNTGARNVAAGAVLHYFGNFTHGAGSTLSGGGMTIWQGGTHTIAGDWAMGSYLQLTNATVTGPGDFTIDGVLSWSKGRLEGAGRTLISPTGKISLMTEDMHVLARDIENNGTLIWNRGGLTFEGAVITNNEDKAFYVCADATAMSTQGVNLIINHGEIRKQLPTDLGFGGVTLDNDGLVNVRNGSFTIDPAALVQLSGTTLTGGSWSVYGTAVLSLSGAAIETIGSAASVTRIGRLAGFAALDALATNEGSITVSGGGALELAPVAGVFTNAGTITLRKGTILRVAGNLVQTPTGLIDIGIASHHMLGAGRMISAQNAAVAGNVTFTLQNGYAPVAGNSFLVLQAASVTGTFAGSDMPVIPGLTTSLDYRPDGVWLLFS